MIATGDNNQFYDFKFSPSIITENKNTVLTLRNSFLYSVDCCPVYFRCCMLALYLPFVCCLFSIQEEQKVVFDDKNKLASVDQWNLCWPCCGKSKSFTYDDISDVGYIKKIRISNYVDTKKTTQVSSYVIALKVRDEILEFPTATRWSVKVDDVDVLIDSYEGLLMGLHHFFKIRRNDILSNWDSAKEVTCFSTDLNVTSGNEPQEVSHD